MIKLFKGSPEYFKIAEARIKNTKIIKKIFDI